MDARSEKNLSGVHADLVKVIRRVYQDFPCFIVTEGLRTVARQKQLLAAGATQTMNSRHLTGHAVDLAATVNGKIRWDWPLYKTLADCVKGAARELNVPIEWGGDWKKFKDGPHFQLPFKDYPK